jgi:L-asparagine transporter-like permease
MLDFFTGALTMTYVLAAAYFVHFWRRSGERLFMAFGIAFGLLAVNQFAVELIGASDERGSYAYVLRVIAFLLIAAAIVDKNLARRR